MLDQASTIFAEPIPDACIFVGMAWLYIAGAVGCCLSISDTYLGVQKGFHQTRPSGNREIDGLIDMVPMIAGQKELVVNE